MRDMFEQVEEWWDNSAELFACCRLPPVDPHLGRHPSERQGAVMTAGLNEAAADSTPWGRCSSAPDHLHSIALRQEQHKLEEKLKGVNTQFVHSFAVPSSHLCSFVLGRIFHSVHPPPRQLHVRPAHRVLLDVP